MRQDAWWLPSALTATVLLIFIAYSTWAAFQNAHYVFGNYLSPFYAPELFGDSPHAWFGPKPGWYPDWLPFSPALLILPAPLGFRLTCYYYRGAYYKAFWADPPGCAVAEPRNTYLGENSFPLILQNIHRYFLYLALLFLVFLSYDVYLALWFENPSTGAEEFGLGVGTLVLALTVITIAAYTFGCHSLRHLVGGRKDELGNDALRLKCYTCVSSFNRWHMKWAWTSLVCVGFADLYVRLCSMGIWTDWRIF
jgi:hypothetical protein